MSKILRKLGLKKSTVIDFWDCSKLNLYDLPKDVFRHRLTLKSLYISNNHIRDIPKTILMIEGLEELDLSENDILFVPPDISKLTKLTTLIISKNSLASVPDAIRHCEQLLTLDLSINPMGSLCEGVMELRQLRKLILNDTQLEELPPNIGKLSKLEILELRENMLQTLPGSMRHLSLLEKLDIGNNEFLTLPTVVGSLESLCELWVDSNTINSIPEELGNLHNLRFLEMSENHIMVLPNTIGGWNKLTDLYANDNLIPLLPDAFGMLSNLKIARLSSNRLGTLPDTVYGLTSLEELDISHNHITDLPNSIGGMTSLVSLNIDENLLTALPAKIGNCTLLKYLSVRDNQLFDIPPECSSLTNLRVLNVVGNRLSHLPYSLTSLKHLSAIWVAENQSRPIVELQVEKGGIGDKWLTCFLFPQQGRESPYQEATSPLDIAADEDPNFRAMHRKNSQVNFDPEALDRRSKLTRDPTPFPKELHNKAMQWRAARDIQSGSGPETTPSSGDEQSPKPEVVTLRNPPRRLVKNRYSFLKALTDPFDEQLRGYNSPPISPPPSDSQKSPVINTSSGRYSPSANGLTQSTGSGSPLPPGYSPNGSTLQTLVGSGPYLIEPPTEFASNNRIPSPVNSLHPPQNGSKSQHQSNMRAGSKNVHVRTAGQESHLLPHDSPNSNGNNNKARNRFANESISLGMVNRVLGSVQSQSPHTLQQFYFPSEASTLSHPETRSSMESGFDADSEPENHHNNWYSSPNSSPGYRHNHDNRPVLGPQVTLPRVHTTSPLTHKHSESRDSFHSGSQMSQHESVSDDYEKLVFNHLPSSHPHSGRATTLVNQRRGSLDAVVMLSAKGKSNTFTYGEQQEYDQAYPSAGGHRPSHSFDATGHMAVRGGGHIRPTPPSVHHSQESHHSPRLPLPPANRPSSRSMSTKTQSERSHHVRNHSQPEHLANTVLPYSHSSTHSQSQPSPSHAHQQRRNAKNDDSMFQSAYPGHHVRGVHHLGGTGSPNHESLRKIQDPRGYNAHKTGRGRFFSDMHSKIVENEPYDHTRHHSYRNGGSYPSHASDESHQSTPVATPTLASKSNYVSGNDSGFESMSRTHKNQYLVELEKNPTLGLRITGGRGGENAIKPGDHGFHVYKITEGLPAHQVGVIAVGDRLLEVNGHDISSMTCEDVLSLLTHQQERTVRLLLCREQSLTLL